MKVIEMEIEIDFCFFLAISDKRQWMTIGILTALLVILIVFIMLF